jgi:hypothetical protein
MAATAQEPLTAQPSPSLPDFSWLRIVTERIPPMRHERRKIPPMIAWEGFGTAALSPAQIRSLLVRGFTQHLTLDEHNIPAAKGLQEAGSPVILMQGAGGSWPSDQAGDPSLWAHQFDAGYRPSGPARPCPAIATGWAIEADKIRATLRAFKAAGVTVDAVWMDWEGDPLYGADRYDQAIHCARCRATLPAGLLASKSAFEDWCRRRFSDLTGAYLAAPILEIFPACSVTNWNAMVSTPDRLLDDWATDRLGPTLPSFFTATNPSAYGDTLWWRRWKPGWKKNRANVDRFWTHVLLRQISDESANRLRWAPEQQSIPWVARWLPENNDYTLPVQSRAAYREVLRHLWLRGIGGMQVFNPRWKGYEAMSIAEVEDAATIYDEMMAFHEFIESGEPMNLSYPKPQDSGAFWSGLRLKDRAVVRTFKQGPGTAQIPVTVWPGVIVTLPADAHGTTCLIRREGDHPVVERLPNAQ